MHVSIHKTDPNAYFRIFKNFEFDNANVKGSKPKNKSMYEFISDKDVTPLTVSSLSHRKGVSLNVYHYLAPPLPFTYSQMNFLF